MLHYCKFRETAPCDKVFVNKLELRTHERTHNEDRSFKW